MKTTAWSLALLASAGSALASPQRPEGYTPDGHSSWGSEPWGTGSWGSGSWGGRSSTSAPASASSSSSSDVSAVTGSSSSSSSSPDATGTGSSSLSYSASGPYSSGASPSSGFPHPSGYGGSSSFPVGPIGSGTGSWTGSWGWPTPSANATSCTSTYTSLCIKTSTLIYRSSYSTSVTTRTATKTTSYAGTCTSVPVGPGSSSSPAGPGSSPVGPTGTGGDSTTVTDYTTIYTTVCPVTETYTSGDATSVSSYDSTSTITSVFATTITVTGGSSPTGPVGPASYGGSSPSAGVSPSSPAGGVGSSASAGDSPSSPAGGVGSSPSAGSSPSGNGSPGSWGSGSPSSPDSPATTTTVTRTPGEVYTTHMTHTTHTKMPFTKPFTYGSWTSIYTSYATSTVTSVVTTVVTYQTSSPSSTPGSPISSGPASSPSGSDSTSSTPGGPIGTGSTSSPTAPISTGSACAAPSSAPSGNGTFAFPACWAGCFAKANITSMQALCSAPQVDKCIFNSCNSTAAAEYWAWWKCSCKGSGPSSGFPHPTGSFSFPVGPTGTGSSSSPVGPIGTGSSSSPVGPIGTGSSSYPVGPTGTGSWSHPVGPTGTGPSSHPVGPIGTGSSSFPGGNGTTTGPTSTSSASSSSSTSSKTSSSSSSSCGAPTPSSSCVPCEGQPGNDPETFCGLTITDNFYDVAPITCKTVEYSFELTNTTVAPDGYERMGLVINGQMPGPLIEANWGDTVVVHLTNSLPAAGHNGSSLHFHGIRQNWTNEFDGVPSLTQCPLAPGESMTYTWRATSYGTSWWHSHYALQTYEGMFGPMIIHGPTLKTYDEEQFIILSDWDHATADEMYDGAQTVGPFPQNGPRTMELGLINAHNTFNGGGSLFNMTVTAGQTYRLRVLNAAIQSTFKFSIDGHKFTVLTSDFVSIEPYETEILNINIGQRYDLLVTFDQTPGDYWMRSDNMQSCGEMTTPKTQGIVHYSGHSGTPTSTAYTYTDECVDEPYESLVPIVQWNAGAKSDEIDKSIAIGVTGGNPNLYKWTLSGTTFVSYWDAPTLMSIYDNGTVPTTSGNLAIQEDLGEWVYVIIESTLSVPHPMHLHGHDFLILAQGTGSYSSAVSLNLNNPPRRDVALMPADTANNLGGYVVVAFYTDNPGVWLFHCHIGWHNSMGFALQIIEGLDKIKPTVTDSCQLKDTCKSWTAYQNADDVFTNDSGV